jgi:hypothetical protein
MEHPTPTKTPVKSSVPAIVTSPETSLPSSIHAQLHMLDDPSLAAHERMQWTVPQPLPPVLTEIDWSRMPAPPTRSFDSFSPSDRAEERKFLDAVDACLPPNDIYRIPIALSRPWFSYVLYMYCFGTCA